MDDRFEHTLSTILDCLKSSTFTEYYVELVLKRLESLTYVIKDGDGWMIAFAVQKVENTINIECNTSTIPEGFMHHAIDRVCGEFLYIKKQSGNLDEFDLDSAIKQVQAGDTTVSFAVNDGSAPNEKRFDALLSYLTNSGEEDLICYRSLRW